MEDEKKKRKKRISCVLRRPLPPHRTQMNRRIRKSPSMLEFIRRDGRGSPGRSPMSLVSVCHEWISAMGISVTSVYSRPSERIPLVKSCEPSAVSAPGASVIFQVRHSDIGRHFVTYIKQELRSISGVHIYNPAVPHFVDKMQKHFRLPTIIREGTSKAFFSYQIRYHGAICSSPSLNPLISMAIAL